MLPIQQTSVEALDQIYYHLCLTVLDHVKWSSQKRKEKSFGFGSNDLNLKKKRGNYSAIFVHNKIARKKIFFLKLNNQKQS